MRQKEIEKLGYVLANPVRKRIVKYLANPDMTPRKFSEIQNAVSTDMENPITNGALGWYLKDLQANGIINKDNKKYALKEFGVEIHNKIKMIEA